MPTVSELFTANWEHFGPVPTAENDWVCNICLGPCRPRYGNLCRGCELLFEFRGAPPALRGQVVPMTSVLERGRWYQALRTYKEGMPDEYIPVLIALARTYLDEHQAAVPTLLGGVPTVVTIVPSKRGDTFESQTLRQVVEVTLRLRDKADLLGHTLRFTGDPETDHRQRYFPDEFSPGPVDVEGERVLVLEDSWASGASAVSAAGALLENGAESVAVLPFARLINQSHWPTGHPYRQLMARRDYDPGVWPR